MYQSDRSDLKLEKFFPDQIFGFRLKIFQPENGYRFTADPLILAAHVRSQGTEKIVDIGCGCAVICLALALRFPETQITGIEIQKSLAEFAKKNAVFNQLEKRIKIVNQDIKTMDFLSAGEKADIIVSNPPYTKKDSGRLSLNCQKAGAKHELFIDPDTLFKYSDKLLKTNGFIYIIFPAQRVQDLYRAMETYGFSTDFIRYIHIKKNLPAKRVVLCAKKNSRGKQMVVPPVYIYGPGNSFSKEYAQLLKQGYNLTQT